MALAETWKHSVLEQTGANATDTRFLFGTEHGNSYRAPGVEAYEVWRPLPVSAAQMDQHALATHLVSRSSIFPRLQSGPEEVKNKLLPHLNEVLAACQAVDGRNTGQIGPDELGGAIKKAGVFLSRAELETVLNMATHTTMGATLDYVALFDHLLGKGGPGLASGLATGRPALPQCVGWPAGAEFQVQLRLRPSSRPYTFQAHQMQDFAWHATKLCRQEVDAEKVHAQLRLLLLEQLVVNAAEQGRPDLSFRKWLADNSVMSLTSTKTPGPIPPEVYDVLDQVIYEGLGVPKVLSAVQIATSMGASMKSSLHRTQ